MHLFVLSDLHLERRPLAEVRTPADHYDVLVCAGDIWEGEPRKGLQALTHLAAGRPVLVVPGNHDRYRSGPDDPRTAAQMLDTMRDEAQRISASSSGPVTILDNGDQALVAGITFVGATLWTDWMLAGLWRPDIDPGQAIRAAVDFVTDAATGSREYRGAMLGDDGQVWHPDEAMRRHHHHREALERTLAASRSRPVVAVTHHAPLTEIVEPYRDQPGVPWWIPAFYGSTILTDLPDAIRPDLWISGHFHAAHDLRIARTRCVANPVAAADYNPNLIINLEPAGSHACGASSSSACPPWW
jgi:Icc-related predicted phosphoesterase